MCGSRSPSKSGARPSASSPVRAVQQPDPSDGVGDLDAVGADVLHRRRTRRAGDAGQAFEPAQPVAPATSRRRRPTPAPASARTTSPSTTIPVFASRTTVRSVRSSAITRLEPPARISASGPAAQHRGRDLPGVGAGDQAARRPVRHAAWSAVRAGRARQPARRPDNELTTAANGSVASYAAFIRHGRRVRRHRRTGAPRVRRRALLAGRLGRFRRRRRHARLRWTSTTRAIGGSSPPRRCAPTGCPRVVTQFHRGDLSFVREEIWTPVTEGRASAVVRATIPGAPASLTGQAAAGARRRRLADGAHRHRRGPHPAASAARWRTSSATSWWTC